MRRLALLLSALLATTPAPGAQVTTTSNAALQSIAARRVVTPGATAPDTPPTLNASITVRYGPARPDAALLLMPGFLGGAGSFDRLARQLVTLNPRLAVWAIDRRSNLLEPQDQIAQATPDALKTIVQRGLPARDPASLSFMKNWGLDVTLRDWQAAILEARTLTPNVFIGGHSLGAGLAAQYAAYDFAGQPGYTQVRGLVMLDGTPALLADRFITRDMYERGGQYALGPMPGLNTLARNPYVNTLYFNPTFASRADAQARLATLNPTAPAPTGGLTTFPATNLAAGLLQLEQQYATIPILTLRTGSPTNARTGPNLIALALGGQGSLTVLGPQDTRQPVGWQADPTAPTDATDFVRRFWTPTTDYAEWYFPQRLTLDAATAGTGTRGTPFEKDMRVWHTAAITTPILGIAAGQGLTRESDYLRYASQTRATATTHTLTGAGHLDITTARSDQVARWILDWMKPLTRN